MRIATIVTDGVTAALRMTLPGTLALLALTCACDLRGNPAPFRTADGLFDSSREDTLGLSRPRGVQTVSIFRAHDSADKYSHGVVLMPFKGSLYAQWQSSGRDEDAPDTWVAYSTSRDGISWSEPRVLAAARKDGFVTSGGWWTDGDTLVAFVSFWPDPEISHKSGFTSYIISADGERWSEPARLLNDREQPIQGIIEQDPHRLPGGRIITAFHEQPGLQLAPYFTDDPLGISGWIRGAMQKLPFSGASSRELEPSWFLRADGSVVMVMRDQAGSFRKLASVSRDRGENWTKPVLTDMPDSRSKQSAGNLPDGSAFLVGSPTGNKNRYPLVITLSRDGRLFDRAWLIRGGNDLPAMRFEGRFKRPGFSYPKSIVWNESLYVSYATNKEDVDVTRVPLDSLQHAIE